MSGAYTALLSPIEMYLQQLHAKYAGMQEGEVASYIPELSRANPRWFGICLATTDGQVYEVGDTRQPFTIQSISKPFVYGLALEDNGKEAILQKIGVEPSGDAFNSISLYPDSGRPFNPMINAGAIATTSLLRGRDTADRFQRILRMFGRYTGRAMTVDHLVYQSEKSTGYRNRAIGYMLRNFAIVAGEPEPVLELYFQQCSITVTCRDLAVMAATLANGGLNPRTGQRAVRHEYVESILSIMSTCGMYDSAGEWIYRVGMPAKSGVAGGILAVLPGQLGIGVFSPLLDKHGNSVRGIRVCQELSQGFHLHLFNAPIVAKSVIRSRYDATQINSRRLRPPQVAHVLRQQGDRIRVYELQGDLVFSTVEVVIRDILSSPNAVEFVILDLKRVTRIDAIACHLLRQLLHTMGEQQRTLLFSHVERASDFATYMLGQVGPDRHHGPLLYADHDLALEWGEDRLLAHEVDAGQPAAVLPLAEHQLCQGLSERDMHHLQSLLKHLTFNPREPIIRAGAAPDHVYLLVRGEVTVSIRLPTGRRKRLSTLSAGMTFGEMALIERSPRSADVTANTPVECYALSLDEFDRLGQRNPSLRATLLTNLLQHLSHMLRRLTQEVAVLAG